MIRGLHASHRAATAAAGLARLAAVAAGAALPARAAGHLVTLTDHLTAST